MRKRRLAEVVPHLARFPADGCAAKPRMLYSEPDFHAPEGWPRLAETDGAGLACMHRLLKAALALKHHPAIATVHRHENLTLRGRSAPDGPRERTGRGR